MLGRGFPRIIGSPRIRLGNSSWLGLLGRGFGTHLQRSRCSNDGRLLVVNIAGLVWQLGDDQFSTLVGQHRCRRRRACLQNPHDPELVNRARRVQRPRLPSVLATDFRYSQAICAVGKWSDLKCGSGSWSKENRTWFQDLGCIGCVCCCNSHPKSWTHSCKPLDGRVTRLQPLEFGHVRLAKPQHLKVKHRVLGTKQSRFHKHSSNPGVGQDLFLQRAQVPNVEHVDVSSMWLSWLECRRHPLLSPNIQDRILHNIGLSGVPTSTVTGFQAITGAFRQGRKLLEHETNRASNKLWPRNGNHVTIYTGLDASCVHWRDHTWRLALLLPNRNFTKLHQEGGQQHGLTISLTTGHNSNGRPSQLGVQKGVLGIEQDKSKSTAGNHVSSLEIRLSFRNGRHDGSFTERADLGQVNLAKNSTIGIDERSVFEHQLTGVQFRWRSSFRNGGLWSHEPLPPAFTNSFGGFATNHLIQFLRQNKLKCWLQLVGLCFEVAPRLGTGQGTLQLLSVKSLENQMDPGVNDFTWHTMILEKVSQALICFGI